MTPDAAPRSLAPASKRRRERCNAQYLLDKGTREIVPRKLCHGMTGRKPRRRPGAEGARTNLAADEGRSESGEGARREARGWTRGSEVSKRQADALAERMRPVMSELAALSASPPAPVDVEARGVLLRRLDQVFGRDDIADRGK
jgi:hypothetical protein